ncbi:MAG: NAD(+)/NADH kinase [Phycisphaerae bacterium]|jgi:NAD+ kinase|nr:NAD(+)/NADH kinase [Phycisphaerae bacterium]HJN71517.1 NAD(+)/NADH kinase [Phycisphaerales bacterium]|tara:strand:- start:2145 stop:2972 length:828 start_codon:yes stop_codon:yes gene_type:complete
MAKKRVILLADRTNDSIASISTSLETHLSEVVEFVGSDLQTPCDAAIAIGGDGTLIHYGPLLAKANIPLIGVNSGRLGFLATFDAASLIEHQNVVFSDAATVISVLLLEISVDGGKPMVAMNEAMIAAGHPFRILEFDLSINGIDAPTLRGDGMIVSTPIGSTAHNVSVGGPIVDPTSKVIVFTPVATHSLAVRPVILANDASIKITLRKANEGTSLIIDGQVKCHIKEGTQITAKEGSDSLRIVLNPSNTYWNTLVDKLHWGAPPELIEKNDSL